MATLWGFYEQGATAWDGPALVELPPANAQVPGMQLMGSDLCLLDWTFKGGAAWGSRNPWKESQ